MQETHSKEALLREVAPESEFSRMRSEVKTPDIPGMPFQARQIAAGAKDPQNLTPMRSR
jgi:hypothetical protein